MSEDRGGVEQAVPAGGRGGGAGAGATTAPLPKPGSVPLDTPVDGAASDRAAGPASRGSVAAEADGPGADGRPAADRLSEQPARGFERPTRRRSDGPEVAPGSAAVSRGSGRSGVRRARLSLRRVDPWSVFVLSLLISLFLGIVLLVAVGLLYLLLQKAGVLSSVDTFARELSLIQQDASIITAGRVMSVAAIVAAVDVVVLTVLATLAAVLYNVCASFTGGIEVTLAERE